MPKGEGLYPAPTKSVRDLDARIAEIQKGTRATVPAMIPLHDILRQKFGWYYKWSTWPAAKFINILILIVYLGGASFFAYNFLHGARTALAATTTYNTVGNTNPADAVHPKATYGNTEANPMTGTEVTTANYTTMGTTDTSFYSTAGSVAVPYQQFRFYVAANFNLAQITQITGNNVGYATVATAPYRNFKIWNRNTTAWESLGTSSSAASPGDTITGSVTTTSTTVYNYVDPTTRYIYFEVLGNAYMAAGNTIFTDKVDTTLTYGVPPVAPTITSPNGNESWPLNSSANPVTWTGSMTNQVEATNVYQSDNFNDNNSTNIGLLSDNGLTTAETGGEIKISGTAGPAQSGSRAVSLTTTGGPQNLVYQVKMKVATVPSPATTSNYDLRVYNNAGTRLVQIYWQNNQWISSYNDGAWHTVATSGNYGNETTEFKTLKIMVNNTIQRYQFFVYDADGTEHSLDGVGFDLTNGGVSNDTFAWLLVNGVIGDTIDVRYDDFMVYPVNSLLSENFDSYTNGSTLNSQGGWTTVGESTYGTVTVSNAQSVSASNSALLTKNTTSGNIYSYKTFTTSNNNIICDTSFRAAQTTVPYDICRMQDVGTLRALVRFSNDDNIYGYNGVTATNIQSTYLANTWYHVKVIADSQRKTYDIYIDGVLKAKDYAFYDATAAQITQVMMLSFGTTAGTGYFDNTQIYSEFKQISGLSASGTSQTWNTTGWAAGTKYLARARTLSSGLFGPWDYSDNVFRLGMPQTPTVTAPNGGETVSGTTSATWNTAESGSYYQADAQNMTVYDNFDDNSMGADWTADGTDGGISVAETGSEIKISGTTNTATTKYPKIKATNESAVSGTVIFQGKFKAVTQVTANSPVDFEIRTTVPGNRYWGMQYTTSGWRFGYYNGSTWAWSGYTVVGNETIEYKTFKVIYNPFNGKGYGFVYDADGTEHFIGASSGGDIADGANYRTWVYVTQNANGIVIDTRIDNLMLYSANSIASDNFDSYANGSTLSDQGGWTTTGESTYGTVTVSNAQSVSASNSMLITKNTSSGNLYTTKSLTASNNTITCEADVRPAQTTVTFQACRLQDSGTIRALVTFSTNGYIYGYNGTGNYTMQTYSANAWYHVRVDANMQTKQYSIYIDNTQKSSNLAFYSSSAAQINQVAFLSNGTTAGTAYIDNVQIYSDFKPISALTAQDATSASWDTSSWTDAAKYLMRVRALRTDTNAFGDYDYSNATFTIGQVPAQPSITQPTADLTGVAVNPTVTSSAYSGSGSHVSSDWEIYDNVGMGAGTRVWYKTGDTTNKVSIDVTAGNGTFENALAGQTALALNTQYWVRVRHTNGNGSSTWSGLIHFTTTAGTPPIAPTGVNINTVSTTGFTVNWTDASSDEDGFKVYISTAAPSSPGDCSTATYPAAGSPDYTTAAGATSQDASSPAKNINTLYCAKVVSFKNAGGPSTPAYSSPIYTLANPPGTPTVNTPTASSLTIIINQGSNPAGPAPADDTDYAVTCDNGSHWAAADGSACTSVTEVWQTYSGWGSGTGKVLSNLSVNTSYTYKVKARNGEDTGTALSSASTPKYTLADTPVAPAVTNVAGTDTDRLNIAIQADTNPSSTEYAISCDNGTNFINASDSSCGTIADTVNFWKTAAGWGTFTKTNLSANTNYPYKVEARNGDKTGTALSTSNSKYTRIEAPTTVTIGTVMGTTITMSAAGSISNLSSGSSGLQFTETLHNSGYGAQTGFANATPPNDWTKINNGTITDTGLTASTEYRYNVKARNGDGTETAPTTPDVSQTTTTLAPPTAPASVNLTTDLTTHITVNWTDSSSNETGFKVWVSTLAADNCNAATYNGSPDITAAANATSWEKTSGLTINTRYCAKVIATNNDGDSSPTYASPAYTLANPPGTSALTVVSTSSINAVLNENGNPGAQTINFSPTSDILAENHPNSNNYTVVDDPVGAPNDADFVWNMAGDPPGYLTDVYGVTLSTIQPTDVINSVTVHLRSQKTGVGVWVKPVIKENGTTTSGTQNNPPASFTDYSQTWTTKPSNSTAWTYADISSGFGIGVQQQVPGSGTGPDTSQVYATVSYTTPSYKETEYAFGVDIAENSGAGNGAVDTNGWVQSNGAIGGASASWKTYVNWGGASGTNVTGLNVNTNYKFIVQARNGDNTATTFNAGDYLYTLAMTPAAPNLSAATTSSITVTLDTTCRNGNPTGPAPAGDTNYAIYNQTLAKYLGSNGTADQSSEVWQTYSAWGGAGGIANNSLTSNTSYTYSVKAKNGNNVLTALGSTNSLSTTSNPNISGSSTLRAGTVRVAVNGALQAQTGTISAVNGTWTISSVAVLTGNIFTVFISDATVANESTAVAKYDGTGDVTGMVLNPHILSIGSADNQSIAVSDLTSHDYDHDNDTHIMFTSDSSTLNVDGGSAYSDETINILASNTLTIAGTETLTTVNNTINGTLTAAGNATFTVTGVWTQVGTFTSGTKAFTVGSYTQSNGTFTGDSLPSLIVNGTFALSTGTFKAPTTLTLKNTFNRTGGTFTHNSGTVQFLANTNYSIIPGTSLTFNNVIFDDATGSAQAITITAGFTVHGYLSVRNTSAGDYAYTVLGTSSPTIAVDGYMEFPDNSPRTGVVDFGGYPGHSGDPGEAPTFTVTLNASNGTGNFSISDAEANMYANLNFTSTTVNQSITQAAGTTIAYGTWTINKSGKSAILATDLSGSQLMIISAGTLDLATFNLTSGDFTQSGASTVTTRTAGSTGTVTINGDFTLSGASSAFTSPNGAMTVTQTFNLSNGTFTATTNTLTIKNTFNRTSGTFTHNSGTVKFLADNTYSIIPGTSLVFNNLTFDEVNAPGTITIGDDFTVHGNLLVNNTASNTYMVSATTNPTITVDGNMNFQTNAQTGAINFGGLGGGMGEPGSAPTFTVTLNASNGNGTGNFTISDNEANMFANLNMTSTSWNQNITQDDGTIAYGTWTINKTGKSALMTKLLNGSMDIVLSNGTLDPAGFNLTAGDFTQSGANTTFSGTTGTVTVTNFSLSGNPSTFTASNGGMTVNGTFTESNANSTFTAPTGTLTIKNTFTRSAGTFTHHSGTVLFLAVNAYYITSGTNLVLNNVTFDDATTSTAEALTIDGDFTVHGNLVVQNTSTVGTPPPYIVVGTGSPTITVDGNMSFPSNAQAGMVNFGAVPGGGSATMAITLNAANGNGTGNFSISDNEANMNANLNLTSTSYNQTITHADGAINYGLWTINKSGKTASLASNALVLGNGADLTLTNGTFYTNGLGLTVAGTFSNNATLKVNGGETLTFTKDTDSGTVEYGGTGTVASLNYGNAYNNLTISGAYTSLTAAAATDVNGTFTQSAGTFVAPATTLNVAGNFTHSAGVFTANNGSVILDGNDQSVNGDTTFYTLSKAVATSRTITFEAGKKQTISHSVDFHGAAGQLLKLYSSASPTQWQIAVPATKTLNYLSVKDSDNSTGTFASPTNSTDEHNNINWFTPSAPTNVTIDTPALNSLTVHWADNSSDETGFKVEQNPTTNCASGSWAEVYVGVTPNETSKAIGSLSANTSYCFRVRAYNGSSNSGYGTAASPLYTLIETPTDITFDTIDFTASSIKMHSTNTPSNLSAGQSGLVFTQTGTGAGGGGEACFTKTTTNTCTDSGLSVNTQYKYKVHAVNGNGVATTDTSPDAPKYTLANTPAAPQVNIKSSSSLTVIIGQNSNPVGPAPAGDTQYAFGIDQECATSCDGIDVGGWVQADGTLGISAVYQTYSAWNGLSGKDNINLSPETTYYYRVQAQNGDSTPTSVGPSGYNTTPGDFVWDGGGTDGTCGGSAGDGNKWSCAANWSNDTVPGASDTAKFTNLSSKASTVDAGFAGQVAALNITNTWVGTITVSGHDLAVSGDLTLAGGTLNGSTHTINIGGSWNSTGGTFTKSTSTVNFNGTEAGKNITTNTQQFNILTFAGTAPVTWTLQDNLTASSLTVTTGQLIDNGKIVTVGGNLIISNTAGLLNSTGSWIQSTSGNISNYDPGNKFNSLEIGASVTSTRTDIVRTKKVILDTNAQLTGGFYMIMNPDANDFIDLGAGASITTGSIQIEAAANVSQKAINTGVDVHISWSGSKTVQMTGNWTVGNLWILGDSSSVDESTALVLDTNSHNLTVNGNVTLGYSSNNEYFGKILFGSGNHTITGNLKVAGSATHGYIDLGSGTTSVGGDTDFRYANVTKGTSTLKLTSTSAGKNIYNNSQLLNNVTFDGTGGGWTLQDSSNIDGNFDLAHGTLLANDQDISVAGDWTNTGTFTAGSGQVVLDGGDSSTQHISGTTSFNNLVANSTANTAGRTLEFVGNSVTTVGGTWTVMGASGKIITLQSSDTNPWTINPTAAAVSYADISRSTNTGVTFCATYSADSLNNTNWQISATGSCAAPVPDAPTIGTPMALSATSIRWTFTNVANETGYKVYAGGIDPVATCNTPDITYCDETGLDVDTQYSGRYVVAHNGSGDSAHSGTAASTYTLANTPSAPQVNIKSSSSLTVIIGQNLNPAGPAPADDTKYAFGIDQECATACNGIDAGGWVQADGTLGLSAVYQTYSAWNGLSGKDSIGLTSDTTYYYRVQAQNGDGTPTSIGPSGSNTTPGDFVWDGGGSTSNWSEAANWSGDQVPGVLDTAKFTNLSSKASVVNAGFAGEIAALNITNTWAGTITVSKDFKVNGDLTLAGGILDGSTHTITISGSWNSTGGIFTKSTSTVVFDAGATDKTITSDNQEFNNVRFNSASGGWTVQDNMASNNFTLTAGIFTLQDNQLTVNGDFSMVDPSASFVQNDTGTKYLILAGTSKTVGMSENIQYPSRVKITGTYTASNYFKIGKIFTDPKGKLIVDGGTLTANDLYTVYLYLGTSNGISIINGGDIQGNADWYMYINGDTTLPGFTATATSNLWLYKTTGVYNLGGNLNVPNKTIRNYFAATFNSNSYDITAANFYLGDGANNFHVDLGSGTHSFSGNLRFTSGSTANGNTLNMGSSNVTVGGDVNFTNIAVTGGTGTLTMSGASKTLTLPSPTPTLYNLTISGTVSQSNNLIVEHDLTVSGNYTLGGYLTVGDNGAANITGGTIGGSSTLFMGDGTTLSTAGTVNCPVTFQLNNSAISTTMPARTYGADVTVLQDSGAAGIPLVMAAGTHNISGNLFIREQHNQVVTLNGTTHNPTVNITGDLSYTGTGSGHEAISMGSGTWSVGGNVDFRGNAADGTVAAGASTLKLTSTSTGENIYNNGQLLNNVTFDGVGGGWTLQDSMNVDGNFNLTHGTLDTNDKDISVAGDWASSGIFTATSAQVVFDGGDLSTQHISGTTTFNNLVANSTANTSGRTLEFAGNSVTTVSGTWTIAGASGKIITLQSSDSNSWTINPTTAIVTYANIARSTNTGVLFCATHSVDSLNNTGWHITDTPSCVSGAPTGLTGTALSATSIRWDWNDNSNNETSFQIKNAALQVISPTLDPGTTTWTETNLSPNVSYTRYVEVTGPFGSGDSDPASRFTLANTPAAVSYSTASGDLTTTSIKWIWDLNGNPNGTKFCINNDSSCITSDNFVDTDQARSANTLYSASVYAKNGDEIPTTAVLQTAHTAIETPTTITHGLITPNSIALNMSDSLKNLASGSSGIQYVENSGNQNGGGEAAFTTWPQTTSTTDTGLKGATSGAVGTTYKYKVKARNAEGIETGDSPEFSFATTAGVQLLFALPGEAISENNASHLLSYTNPTPNVITAGVPFDLTIFAADGNDYRDLAHQDTITLSSTDSQASFPPPSQMASGEIVYNGVVINTIGQQTISGSGSAGTSHEFTVTTGATSPILSTVSANPSLLNTGDTSVITVTLKDLFGNKIAGHTVWINTNRGFPIDNLTNNGAVTDANGEALIYLNSAFAGTSTISATDSTSGVALASHPQVTFNSLPIVTSLDNPNNFTGTAGNKSTSLSWDNSAGTDHIHVYRSTTSGDLGALIADNITGTSYDDSGLTNGTTYYYILKASDASGNLSSGTYQLSLKPTGAPDNQNPSAPTNLHATNITSSSIALTWDDSRDNIGVVGYLLFNADSDLQIAATVDTSYAINDLTPLTTYRFYVKSYDAAGRQSASSNTLKVTTLSGPSECTGPDCVYVCRNGGGRVAFLVLSNVPSQISSGESFPDNVKVKAIAADAGGNFCEDYRGSVYFTSTDNKADLTWGSSHPYVFNKSDAGEHEFKGSDFTLNTVGDQTLTITDTRASGEAEVQVLGNVIFQKAQNKITDFFDKNASKVNTAVVTTTTALLLAPAIANVAIGLGNILPQLLYWFSQLLQLLGIRKRRKPWGLVFNSQTGQPVSLAVVRIYDKEYNRLLEQAVTDREGRFGFLAKPGTFYIVVRKSGFTFPSAYKVSSFFDKIYTGGNIELTGRDEAVTFNIPLDPQTKASTTFNFWVLLVKINRFLQRIRIPLLVIGTVFAVVMIITNYNIVYVLSLVFYAFLAILEYFHSRKARPYGIVSDVFGHPLEIAMVRIYEKKTNRMVATDVTDAQGRFHFLVNPGIYYLTATKPGYLDFKSHIMYLEKERTLVTSNIKLKKVETK